MSKANNVEEIYPLSATQQGMLFHLLFSGHQGQVYFDQYVATLVGHLDAVAWRQAWSLVLERHPVLRSQFLWERRERPLQVVRRDAVLPWQEHDWRHLPAAEREERFAAFLREDQELGFDLGKPPLTRIAIIRWGEDVHKLVWSFHHIAVDGWSIGLVLADAFAFYRTLRDGGEVSGKRPRPYRDYVTWLQGQDSARAESFWRRTLAGFGAANPLPYEGTGAGGDPTGWVAREEVTELPPDVTASLQTLARRYRITLNTLFQAAWSLLLSRYATSTDVVFGAVVAGRPPEIEGVESMVGLFINLLPVRVETSPDHTVLAWLKALQEQQFEQREYEHNSLDQILAWSEVGRRGVLFETVLVFENYPVDALHQEAAALGLELQEAHLSESSNFPLTLYVVPAGDRVGLRLNYHWTRISSEAARRILAHLTTLLGSLLARPEGRLGDLTILDADERLELLSAGRGPVEPGEETTIHRLVEAEAERTPDAPAVETATGLILTYGELMARAGALACHLRRLGVGPESIVGLCVERSPEMVVGMLGVLKAGGAYLPLDPAYPRERLAFMLEDSGARLVLTQERLEAGLPAAPPRVRLDADWPRIEQAAGGVETLSEADPRHPAYVIYTSGSTGRPKGVVVPHASLVNFVLHARKRYAVTPGDRVLQFASISFDTSAEEIYPCLTRGATLVLRGDKMAGSLERFAGDLERLGITVLDLPTAYWHELVAEMSDSGLDLPAGVRLVILGGEQAQADRLTAWRARIGQRIVLINTYGPTEATIVSTQRDLTAGVPPGDVPIGRAVPNARVLVLDRDQELVPAGVVGELYLGGSGLARCYLGRPELTAERFVPDPFAPRDGAEPGGRLYRTGDLARLRPAGDLEFRGRTDDQVKVRGFRIELGEIEVALRRLSGVRDAVVAMREDSPGQKRLVAYVVPGGDTAASVSELRQSLKETLPDYMVPSAFVVLEALPLTASGKLDRRALPEPGRERPDLDGDYAAPRNPVEEMLCDIWCDLLGIERIGIHDDFFQLGGHSLLVARLAARVRQAIGVELPLVEVFKQPTVAELAAAIERAEAGTSGDDLPELPPLTRAPRDRPIPLSFPQERVWFLNQLSPGGNIAYNFQFTLWLRGPLLVAAYHETLREIVRRHEVLRTSFPESNGRPIQVIHPTMEVEMPLIDLSALPPEPRDQESERLVFESTQTAFDIARIPLLRWLLLRLEPGLHEMIQVEHHFVHDGWSFGVLLREIKAIYAAFTAGQPSPLPPLTIQYADFAAWQREWMEGPVMERIMAYWRQKLAGSPTFLELPTDRPRQAKPSFNGDITIFPVPPLLYDSLRAFGRAKGFTLYMTMLSGFFALLARYTGQDRILVGTNNANRRARESENLLGMIVNSLVIQGDLQGNPDFQALLGRVRETSLENYVYQDTPFERLVQELKPERQLGRNPLFQLMFNFHDAAIPDLEFGGLKGVFLVRGNRSAKMDMNVIMVPRAEQRVGLGASEADRRAVFHWEYNTDLFDFTTIQRMIEHYQTLLAGVVANPLLRVSELPLLTLAEQRQTLIAWNDTVAEEPASSSLSALFEAQARRTPDAVALSCDGLALTYRQLDERAEILAERLRAMGVRPEVLVGVLLHRSLDLPVALLAVLKAGGAYVPLDPSFPPDRLSYVLEDGRVAVLITERELRDSLPQSGARVLEIEEAFDAVAVSTPAFAAEWENTAYVIYTSGSTGRPKGVEVRQRGVLSFLASMARRPGLGAGDVMLAVTTVAFDISVLEIFLPLSVGARVELAGRDVVADGARLAALLESSSATAMQATPATWRMLIEAGWDGKPGLQALCGGEALPADLARELLARVGPSGSLWNLYGPTETTVWSAVQEVSSVDRLRVTTPIGRPIANTTIQIRDRDFAAVPAGIPGELYIGGTGVARGYLRRPDLTAERFLPDPLAEVQGHPGARLYRTGDLARFLADGTIEFLGRADAQVKIRGFRIEPGEIEAVLAALPEVETSVVIAREDVPGDRRLVAYVVAAPGCAPEPARLRSSLAERLPSYMVPAAFVALAELPLGPTGKVDRRALPAPAGEWRERREAEPSGERSPVEELLAGLWADLLGVTGVASQDSFFELGGHSLLATRMISRVRALLDVELPIRAVFENPTLARFAAWVERALREDAGTSLPPLAAVPRGGPLPTSFSQQRLWFIDRLAPGGFAYNLTGGVRLAGSLEVAALAGALSGIVRRHESLRTWFVEENGEPQQVIAEPAPLPLPVLDLSSLAPAAREEEARRFATEEARRPFDLARGPLVRSALMRLGEREHALLVSMHHIVSDGWSMGIFVRELGELYRALAAGEPAILPELPIQYADFTVWQRQWLSGAVLEEQLAWWFGQLAGAPPVLELPLDRPRPAVQSYRGSHEHLALGSELEERLERKARNLGVTPFMILLAGFATLLSRYAGQDDVVVGVPIANRRRAELEDLIGFFANTLALRVDLAGDPTLGEQARRVRDVALGAYAHQEVPFERLMDELRPERDLSHAPVFQVMLAMQNLPASHLDLAGLTLSSFELDARRTHFDLSLFLIPRPGTGGLLARLDYSTDLFDAATIERMIGHLHRLLKGIAAEGSEDLRLSALPLMDEEEREQVLRQWNDTATAYPREATIPGLFAEQARRTPDALAVVGGGEELTYAELDRRAERLAASLLAAGVRPDEAVGLCAERSAGLIAALLGILKAGGAYVPLDPAYPRERLAGMLADAGARIVVVQEGFENVLPEISQRGGVRLPLGGTLGMEGGITIRPDLHPDQLAYVLFTSGSTGRPKGVAVTHRNVVRLVRETGYLHFGPDEVFLQLAPVSFDASTLEIWGPLLNGGRLAVYPPGPLDLRELGDTLERYGVTTLWLTAGLFHQMAESHLDGLRPVRQLAAGGDVLSPDLVRRALAGLPGTTLINGYGPTEGTTFTCCHVMRCEADLGAGSVPIGKPIANTRVYLLDAEFRPVPVGIVGQLYAAGDGLARGYAGDPKLTAERFLPDPVGGEPGARLYATGDLARWRPSGEIEFLGRADAQVKIRGFRIEPGEIESVLAAHPGVETALVIVREDEPGERRLVAYVVAAPGCEPEPAGLRSWLAERLPSYMVPAAFVALDRLPLGPTGKVDRRALPAPEGERREAGPAGERSPVEELLAGLWASLLNVAGVASQDSFFELGGHSLLATRLVSRVREVFGVELPLRSLFESPTLAGSAALIEEAQAEGLGLQAPPILPIPPALRGGELQASFAQERLWFLDRFGADRASYNVPFAIRLHGWLKVPALAACLTEIARRHETLRTTFTVTGGAEPRVLQVIAPPCELPVAVVDLAALAGPGREAEALRLTREEARRLFDLERGPLVRASLVRLGEAEHTLLLTLHHVIADGWSNGVLLRELSALYPALVEGLPSPLPDLPVQYADFATWQRGWLQGEVLESQLGWWRGRLAGAPAVVELPADRPRPPVQRARGGRQAYELPLALSQGLQALVRAEGATLFMALLAGFQALLARTTGGEDLPVGTPIANRNRAEIENLIGFFVNTLVLRGDLAGDPSFRELLARSRESALGAYAHQDVPFEKLVEELRPERDLSHAPLFQAMVILQNAHREALELPGLTIEPLGTDSGAAKFDLRLSLVETPEGLTGSLVYNRDLFDDATVARLGGYLETLLAAAVAFPELPLSALPLLGEAERRQLLGWGDERPVAGGPSCLHSLFAAQAASAPERPAVTCAGESLSYRELDERSNRLAHFLIAEGVRPGDLVGLCLERSPGMAVAILGVLKAGGAYLPLDPAYPKERLAFAIADSRIAVIVTEESVVADLPARAAGEVRLDADRAAIDAQSAESPGVAVTPDFPAYVIYTSGSTGRPKGVVVTHANASRLFSATQGWFGFGPDDVWTLFHSYAFDFSVWELWGALLYGGRLVVVPYWVSRSPQAFYELVRDEGVTVLNQTPSAFRQLIWAEQSPLTSLRYVIFGGEALELASLSPWMERHGDEHPRLVNMYGITETTVHVTYRPLSRQDVEAARGSVLGVPIPDLSLRVLDRHLGPQPIGVPGEIHVGGAGLAQGYLGRPELTAERFMPDPFGAPGSRLYRSGDLARYLADGDLEYLGRIDHQVKIRGFRIELGEIETALTSQPEVREAVVLAREDTPGEKRLVAYLVASDEVPAGVLRDRLKAKLPEYMVPAAFVTLPALPLTANGKVDRKALPAPESVSAVQPRERVAPRNELERFLAGLWPGETGDIGIEDDFFELGGNSITGALLINRLQAALGEIVHVVVIFDAPTIALMAAYLIENHPEAVARVWGIEPAGRSERVERIDAGKVARMRTLIRPLAPLARSGPKNPPAVFVLAPPRSGTTLMRVLLGGHPRLFAPPELELLSFNTLAERRASYTGRDAFWLEGLVRAVMEVRGCTPEEATRITEDWAEAGWTSRRVYGQLQEWLGERILVDKTPSYALDRSILERAEEDFSEPLYVHLVRHPYGMIRSFEEAKLDQIFFRQDHPFGRRELAELIWLVSQENILGFLEGVPPHRRHQVHFEDLLREPEGELRRLCGFLGLEWDPVMVRPYEDSGRRMTDGIHAESRMLGDVKFHTHSGIDASTAERWREAYREDFLGVPTAEMANALGYVQVARSAATIPRRAWQPGELRPVSFAQQRLWFLDRLEPGGFAYNLTSAVRLSGALDAGALAGALSGIVGRHESLRTTFVEEENGEPRQSVAGAVPLPLPVLDLSGLSPAAREEETRRIGRAETRRPYDLSRGPLVRFALLRLDEREHVLLVGMHHIVSDGWSMGIFVRELGALYRALATGEPAAFPALPIQYSDFAAWQREWLTGQILEERLGWWTKRLSGAPPLTELPLDRPRPAVRSHRGANAIARFEGLRLEALSRRLGVTPFMALLAGFTTLLSRYGGQTDLVVGSPVANRAHAEVEGLIGFFANTLALRFDLAGNPTFRELAGRVQAMAVGAYAHQDVPFERLVEELRPERNMTHSPVFQVLLALQNTPKSALDLAGLTLSRLESDVGRSQFDLAFFVSPLANGGLYMLADYAQDLFDAGTVQRLLGHFHRLLEAAGGEGGESARLSELPLLAPEERTELLAAGNGTVAEVPGRLLHQLFEAMAAERPEAVAVSCEGEALSYGELNSSANRLAHYLRRLGVGPESLVAVCLERSPALLVALLGVLKAGGAYVPLDPTYPADRIAWVLEDSRASVLLTQSNMLDLLPGHGRTIALDRVDLSAESLDDPLALAGPENLAYVIYTSGSTGRPKGVAVRQRGAVNFLASMARRPGLGPDDVLLAVTTIAFDISVLELFLPLSRGARVELVGRDTAADGFRLKERIAESGATVMQATPATWRLLLEAGWEGSPGLKVLCGGEALPPELARELLARTRELWNVYGPTETTVWSALHPVSAEDAEGSRAVPLGESVANTQIHLLDRFEHGLDLVPPGAPGELYIGGEGLARGYVGRPDLTAERFVPDPFGDRSGRPGARLYRTGDLVRRQPQGGALEFLGRADHQVKIRGFRIELGEIEAVLGAHPAVRDCAVTVREDVPGTKLLVAYLVFREGAAGDLETLRSALRAKLPEYMVPPSLVVLESLPLTPNGKVDRRALPAPDGSRHGTATEYVAPRNSVEEALTAVWAEVLRRDGIGIHDNFFELGGDSIQTIQIVARSRKRGIRLSPRQLFEHQTIAELAAVAQVEERRAEPEILPETVPVPPDAGGFTPSDFPVSRLDQEELDELLVLLGQSVE